MNPILRSSHLFLLVLFAALGSPLIHAQNPDVKPPNKSRSAKYKSAIFRGSGNVILSNSLASFIGGFESKTTGVLATIPGGNGNAATNYSFAAGRYANAEHEGSFVWGSTPGILATVTESFAENAAKAGHDSTRRAPSTPACRCPPRGRLGRASAI